MDHKAWNWGQDKFYLRQVYLTKCYLWIIFINIQAIERYPKKKRINGDSANISVAADSCVPR